MPAMIRTRPIEVANALTELGLSAEILRDAMLVGESGHDDANFSTVVSQDGRVAIAVATGDGGTGSPADTPKTKYPKGPATLAAINRNKAQLELFEPNQIIPKTAGSGPETWMLVRRRTEDALFSELSLPKAMDEDGRVKDWAIRIIFEPIPLEPTPALDTTDQSEPIVIDVRRRS